MNHKNTSLSIKNWKEDDKPREKMILKGKEVVSDAELIAILIGSGSREESAVDLSKRILSKVENNLNNLAKLSIEITNWPGKQLRWQPTRAFITVFLQPA